MTEPTQHAETVAETEVWVDHEVFFHLKGADRFVVPRRRLQGYALVDWITVHLPASRQPWLSAGGAICKKDGTLGTRWGYASESVDLLDADLWIERARRQIDGSEISGESDG